VPTAFGDCGNLGRTGLHLEEEKCDYKKRREKHRGKVQEPIIDKQREYLTLSTIGSQTRGGAEMKRRGILLSALIVGVSLSGVIGLTAAHADDQEEIKALEQRYVTAAKAKDIKAIMACYVPDESLLVFDVVPPRQYVGAKAYQKDWEELFAAYPGPAEMEMSDLSVMTEGKLGYGHNIQHSILTDKDGKKATFIFRVTNGYRKLNGKWLISHEHVSLPVDLATGKADLTSKP